MVERRRLSQYPGDVLDLDTQVQLLQALNAQVIFEDITDELPVGSNLRASDGTKPIFKLDSLFKSGRTYTPRLTVISTPIITRKLLHNLASGVDSALTLTTSHRVTSGGGGQTGKVRWKELLAVLVVFWDSSLRVTRDTATSKVVKVYEVYDTSQKIGVSEGEGDGKTTNVIIGSSTSTASDLAITCSDYRRPRETEFRVTIDNTGAVNVYADVFIITEARG